jgi:L-alanine-DL-glutamate epimerase-like enolase superfamily enzyme
MKITNPSVIVCSPDRNFVTLKIETVEGLIGIGDATLNGRELSVASYLTDHVIPCLIGRDAHQIIRKWATTPFGLKVAFRGLKRCMAWAAAICFTNLPMPNCQANTTGPHRNT